MDELARAWTTLDRAAHRLTAAAAAVCSSCWPNAAVQCIVAPQGHRGAQPRHARLRAGLFAQGNAAEEFWTIALQNEPKRTHAEQSTRLIRTAIPHPPSSAPCTLSFCASRLAAAAVLAGHRPAHPRPGRRRGAAATRLLAPTSKEQTKPNEFKKPGPGASACPSAAWATPDRADDPGDEIRRVAGPEHRRVHLRRGQLAGGAEAGGRRRGPLLAEKVDAIIIGRSRRAIGAPLSAKAAKTGIPVIVLGAFGTSMQSTVEIMGGGEVPAARRRIPAQAAQRQGNIWAFRGVAGVEEEQLAATTASASRSRVRTSRSRRKSSATGTTPRASSCARTWCCPATAPTASGSPAPR